LFRLWLGLSLSGSWLAQAILPVQAEVEPAAPAVCTAPAIPSRPVMGDLQGPAPAPLARPVQMPNMSGIRIYASRVDCDDPDVPEITLPYEAFGDEGQRLDKTLYVCVDAEGTAQLTMWAETLGYASGVGARFACDAGDCGAFTTVAPETEIPWANGSCRHMRKQFMESVTLLPGKYTLYTMADNVGSRYCGAEDRFTYIYMDLTGTVVPNHLWFRCQGRGHDGLPM